MLTRWRTLEQMDTSDTQVRRVWHRVALTMPRRDWRATRDRARHVVPCRRRQRWCQLEARRSLGVCARHLIANSVAPKLDEVSRQVNLVYNPEYHAKIVSEVAAETPV